MGLSVFRHGEIERAGASVDGSRVAPLLPLLAHDNSMVILVVEHRSFAVFRTHRPELCETRVSAKCEESQWHRLGTKSGSVALLRRTAQS